MRCLGYPVESRYFAGCLRINGFRSEHYCTERFRPTLKRTPAKARPSEYKIEYRLRRVGTHCIHKSTHNGYLLGSSSNCDKEL
jgi:hypothetical protein